VLSFLKLFPGLAATFSVNLATVIASAVVSGSVLGWSAWSYVGVAQGMLKGWDMCSWDKR